MSKPKRPIPLARLDASKAAQLEEQYKKERRLQKQVLIQQEAAGLIHPKPPVGWVDKKNRAKIPAGPVEPPALLTRTMPTDPAQAMGLTLSRNLWASANPAYVFRDPMYTVSAYKQDYLWDEDEIAVLRANGDLDKRFNRRRDDMTRYVEASVQFKMLGKKIGGESAKSTAR
ncbi:hypothetical protein WJX74_002629 [Apatococcus lobatus]|uniref:Uncharacterized protein n=1 Tax=Apatococcus lobatus TaxID=904363 RepID=A0AAW1QLG9_9CHLO